jgi:hypothetical protein
MTEGNRKGVSQATAASCPTASGLGQRRRMQVKILKGFASSLEISVPNIIFKGAAGHTHHHGTDAWPHRA